MFIGYEKKTSSICMLKVNMQIMNNVKLKSSLKLFITDLFNLLTDHMKFVSVIKIVVKNMVLAFIPNICASVIVPGEEGK